MAQTSVSYQLNRGRTKPPEMDTFFDKPRLNLAFFCEVENIQFFDFNFYIHYSKAVRIFRC